MDHIQNKNEISYQLHEILKPIWEYISEYNWVITDLDFMSDDKIPLDFDHDYFILNKEELKKIYQSDIQIIWGIISAVPKEIQLDGKLVSNLSAED